MQVTTEGHVTNILLEGMLTSTSSIELEDQLNAIATDDKCLVIISFQNLSLITSAGIRVILSFTQRMTKSPGKLALCEIPGNIYKMFEATGFDTILPIYERHEQALAAVTGKF